MSRISLFSFTFLPAQGIDPQNLEVINDIARIIDACARLDSNADAHIMIHPIAIRAEIAPALIDDDPEFLNKIEKAFSETAQNIVPGRWSFTDPSSQSGVTRAIYNTGRKIEAERHVASRPSPVTLVCARITSKPERDRWDYTKTQDWVQNIGQRALKRRAKKEENLIPNEAAQLAAMIDAQNIHDCVCNARSNLTNMSEIRMDIVEKFGAGSPVLLHTYHNNEEGRIVYISGDQCGQNGDILTGPYRLTNEMCPEDIPLADMCPLYEQKTGLPVERNDMIQEVRYMGKSHITSALLQDASKTHLQ